jgi:AcrR family transcriptional regulator
MPADSVDREALLDTLLEVFQRKGYEGTSLAALAAASQRGKASLYHHFPGGKAEIVAILVRRSISALQDQAFRHLSASTSATERIGAFVDGFLAYTQAGNSNCLLVSLALTNPELLDASIAERFEQWESQLSNAYTDLAADNNHDRAGAKSARHRARATLARLYGSLLLSRLQHCGEHPAKSLRQTGKRLKKELRESQ